MSDVHDWDPASHTLGRVHRELLNHVASEIEDEKLRLEPRQLDTLRSLYLINAPTWTEFAADKSDEELNNWIKVLTLCPEQYSGFAVEARSPVIPIVRALRQRGTYSTKLNNWIKTNSSNRFLPHGSLADRLR